ncbi:MAG: pyridoxamine 5'-phosphate oxidase family protein [Burkholderiales bacterium]|nr:MAG: pyridoxamine 5'-phosphate oxidase family protein [Burkholderiales bacterium]
MYHNGNRELQAIFGSTKLADRLAERLRHSTFTDDDKAFIESLEYFFLATATPVGQPDCSFKGGPPGFVRILAPDLLVWPDYDGNGMFKSLGNIAVNPSVGLLFISMGERPRRIRVNGTAEISLDDPLMQDFPGAQAIIRVTPIDIFPNCPRYIPNVADVKPSPYTPTSDEPPVEPKWKSMDMFKDVVPPRKT